MKIIKKGKIAQYRSYYKDTCEYCGCIFEFADEDIEERERTIGGHVTYHCPYCSRKITKRLSELERRKVEEEYIPPQFKDDKQKEV